MSTRHCSTPNGSTHNAYLVPAAEVETEVVVKKSRFISRAAFAADREQAQQLLAQAKSDYPDARHHCWAYLLGSPQSPRSQAFADDGEPGGTAGKPILNVLQHGNFGDTMLIVIRYFGGIKLGAGGLVRAYSQSAQTAMEQLDGRLFERQQALEVRCDFSKEQPLRHWLAGHNGSITTVTYVDAVVLQIALPISMLSQWQTEAARLNLSYKKIALLDQ
ncbi:MAG: YigZ family protein [Halopseudomonas sp.]